MNILPAASVYPRLVSSDASTGRHADTRYPVEHGASNLCLDPLIGQSPGLKSPANDGFVPINRSFDQAPEEINTVGPVGGVVAPAGIGVAAVATTLLFLGGLRAAVIGAALWGVDTATQDTVFHALLARHVPQDRRASAYGLFDALRGTAWLLGSAALGILYTVGPAALVGISLMLQLAAIPVLTSMSRRGDI